ncbi:MAG: hypothetical protein GY892_10515, partial [Shimia sp.]|nr:hypothetical protein [Shimia sp.]
VTGTDCEIAAVAVMAMAAAAKAVARRREVKSLIIVGSFWLIELGGGVPHSDGFEDGSYCAIRVASDL